MPDVFSALASNGSGVAPAVIVARLVIALALGAVVAWIYARSSGTPFFGESFPVTLILLAVLIAMVTQVIGDNVARAFSLVGALSIVRFRTVVRDTRDTAFVIFSVVVGMAVGGNNLWVAAIGIVVVGAAAFTLSKRQPTLVGVTYLLTLRVGPGQSVDELAPLLGRYAAGEPKFVSVGTAKMGAALSYVYELRLSPGSSPEELVKGLNLMEGVQDVRLERRPSDLA